MNLKKVLLTSFATIFVASFSFAQSAVADLQQDMAILKREVGQLRLEVEQLRRENTELERKIKSAQTAANSPDTSRQQMTVVRAEITEQNNALKREIISQVKKDMEAMATQTNASLDKLAAAIGARPTAPIPTNFGDDYPKTGITYTVKSGDTLGKIARVNNSKIKWIQDANKISDPARGLKIGEQIFIPQN